MFESTEEGKDLYIHTNVVLRNANTRQDEFHSVGSLNIVEYSFGKCIEWKPTEDSVVSENQDQDPEWSLVDTHPTCSRTSSEGADSLGRSRTVRILFSDLSSICENNSGQQLIFIQKDDTAYFASFQLLDAEKFVKSLKGYIKFVKSSTKKNMYNVVDEVQTVLSRSFAELDLFPDNTSHYVWKFVKNFQDHPLETTLGAFSKLGGISYYKYPSERPMEETVTDVLNNPLPIDADSIPHLPVSVGSGEEYELIDDHELGVILPPRPLCLRGTSLSQEEWSKYNDSDGRISNPEQVKEIIFHGGIVPSLRFEVWKFLLNYYPWNSTRMERLEIKKKKTDEYFAMKLQWKSMTPVQENNFSDYRDRKNLIEKDVNRTDRTHPYYSGDSNPNLAQLYDILMTYVMYNFDLGYVQGMSDLLSPILSLMDNEVDAFWCFVGFMNKMSTNFEIDQAGMKTQLCQLYTLLSTTDPRLAHYLSEHDSENMFFCFRWLLVLFKREFSTLDIMQLWEVLWTDLPCKNFHLLFCAAILDSERSSLMEHRLGFTEILKHINDLSLKIDLSEILCKAEGIYCQLKSVAKQLPDNVRVIIGLDPLNDTSTPEDLKNGAASHHDTVINKANCPLRKNSTESGSIKFGNNEVAFERGLDLSYM